MAQGLIAALWYEAMRCLCAMGLIVGFGMRSLGHWRVPRRGPVLLLANHQSFLDPVLVGAPTPRQPVGLARQSLFRVRWFGALLRSLGGVPIDLKGPGREGLQTILGHLQAGRAVVIYPEGERTWDGRVQSLKPGITLLIERTRAPIVLVGIAGAYEAWPRQRLLPVPAPLFLSATRGRIAVAFSRPIDARTLAELPRAEMLARLRAGLQAMCERAERLRRGSGTRTIPPPLARQLNGRENPDGTDSHRPTGRV